MLSFLPKGNGAATRYGYDAANRLTTTAVVGGPGVSSFTFDSLSRKGAG